MIKERPFELERLAFFSDAVFAIAITLLVVDLRLPAEISNSSVNAAIEALIPNAAAYALSFFVIGSFWVGHHRVFQYIEQWDSGLVRWNIIELFFVAVQPATTSLLGEHGNLPLPAMIYAVALTGAGLASAGLWLHAFRAGLVASSVSPTLGRHLAGRAVIVSALFMVSIPIAAWRPTSAPVIWVLAWPAQAVLRRLIERQNTGS